MPPASGSSSSTVQLPNDVLAIIVSYLDKRSLLQILFCGRWLAREAARYLFDEVRFQMRVKDLERVIGIANSNMIADPVKVLRLQQTPRLPEVSFKDWCAGSYWGKKHRRGLSLYISCSRSLPQE